MYVDSKSGSLGSPSNGTIVRRGAFCRVSGCSTMQSRSSSMAQWQIEQERVSSYCRDLFRDSALDSLRVKMAIESPKDTTFEMLTDQSRPTQSERLAIVTFARDKQECNRAWSSSARRFPIPAQAIVLREANAARFQFLLADLHGGVLPMGSSPESGRNWPLNWTQSEGSWSNCWPSNQPRRPIARSSLQTTRVGQRLLKSKRPIKDAYRSNFRDRRGRAFASLSIARPTISEASPRPRATRRLSGPSSPANRKG